MSSYLTPLKRKREVKNHENRTLNYTYQYRLLFENDKILRNSWGIFLDKSATYQTTSFETRKKTTYLFLIENKYIFLESVT